MKRDILNSPRLHELKKRRQKVFLKKILVYVFLFIIVVVCLAYLSRLNKLNITDIEISGNRVIDTEIIKNVVTDTITGNYLWFFPKKNILYYSKNNITKVLAEKFKRLKDMNIKTSRDRILEISVTERVPKYTWCGPARNAFSIADAGGETLPEKCYFMDDTGFIFDEAPKFSGDVYFKFFGIALESDLFKNFISFKENLERLGMHPVIFYNTGSGEERVYLSSNTEALGPQILFKQDADFSKLAENIQSALGVEPLHTDFKKKYSSLLYIDLRYGNKVYYKFRP